MRCLINSTIADIKRKENIGKRVIENILNRQVEKEANWTKYKELNTIGIDEIALRKGQSSYVTVVSAKVTEDSKPIVIGVLPNREKVTVQTFLHSIPESFKAKR